MPNIKNDTYPIGIYAKARSRGSKKGLGCENTCESNPACGRAWTKLREQKSVRAEIKPENGAESHQSSARFVGRPFFFDRLIMIFVALRKGCHALGKCFLSLILSIF